MPKYTEVLAIYEKALTVDNKSAADAICDCIEALHEALTKTLTSNKESVFVTSEWRARALERYNAAGESFRNTVRSGAA